MLSTVTFLYQVSQIYVTGIHFSTLFFLMFSGLHILSLHNLVHDHAWPYFGAFSHQNFIYVLDFCLHISKCYSNAG